MKDGFRIAISFMLIVAAGLVLQACNTAKEVTAPPVEVVGEVGEVTITSVEAISDSSVVVTFSGPVSLTENNLDMFEIQSLVGRQLEVSAVYVSADKLTVTLATAKQTSSDTYELSVQGYKHKNHKTGQKAEFDGSGDKSPIIDRVLSLNAREVIVRFSHHMEGGEGILDAKNYKILDPDLRVISVDFPRDNNGYVLDGNTVILKTAVQLENTYKLKVTNVFTQEGKGHHKYGYLIDHFGNTATFEGSPANDNRRPQLTSAVATSNTTVLLSFSEPVTDTATDVTNYELVDANGAALVITSAELNLFKTQATLTTLAQAKDDYTLSVKNTITDSVGNKLVPATLTFTGIPVGGLPNADDQAPKVANAGATSNTTVLVTFDEPVKGGTDSAENPLHYTIASELLNSGQLATQALVLVNSAALSADGTTVTLTTSAQSELEYQLFVANVKDLAGNQISPKDRITGQTNIATFYGVGPSGTAVDTDGDGLSDADEQLGWTVTVILDTGEKVVTSVTSDPTIKDTDDDGLNDLEEKTLTTDPRRADTDNDDLSDFEEANIYYSDYRSQDSDGDGLFDGLEVNFFKISPVLADTDGDQLSDGDEVITANRDPRIADVPIVEIVVGDINLSLDERFDYTDSTGKSLSTTESTSTTLEQGTERAYATSDSQTMTSALSSTTGVSATATLKFPKLNGSVSATVSTELTASSSREYSSQVSTQSAVRANQAYNNSFEKSQTIESESEVSRSIEAAEMLVTIDIGNLSDVAFSVSDIEITALQQDPVDRSRSIPITTLIPSSGTNSYNVGPGNSKNSIVFKSREVFPQTIENLMKDPRGLVFRVANYNLTDEANRNFAYSSQEVNDRTANIVIDYGNGRVDTYNVATYNGFDSVGTAQGITMAYALQDIIGLSDYDTANVDYDGTGPDSPTAFKILNRIGSLSTDIPNKKAWVTFTSQDNGDTLDQTTDFNDLILQAGDVFRIGYMQDLDNDGLYAREEYLYGSSDEDTNSDNKANQSSVQPLIMAGQPNFDETCQSQDLPNNAAGNSGQNLPLSAPTISCDRLFDTFEVREGWQVVVRGQTQYQGYPDPRRADSDSDGLSDHREFELGTDPRKRDTDADGLSDFDEVFGFLIRFRGQDDDTPIFSKLPSTNYVTNPLDSDSDGDGIGDGYELTLGSNPQVDDAAQFIDTDKDGLSDFEEVKGYTIVVNGVSVTVKSSKYVADSDDDGLTDLLEFMIKTNPREADTDSDLISDFDEFNLDNFSLVTPTFDRNVFSRQCARATNCAYDKTGSKEYISAPFHSDIDSDGLNDKEELIDGWILGTVNATEVKSDPLSADTDTDGLTDKEERTARTNPNSRDTDGDGVGNNNKTDGAEIAAGLNPLVKDQKIKVTYINIVFGESGDNGNDGDYNISLKVRLPGGAEATLYSTGDKDIEDEETVTLQRTKSFIKKESDNFDLFGKIFEQDPLGATECLTSFNIPFPGLLSASSGTQKNTGGGDCVYNINYSIDIE